MSDKITFTELVDELADRTGQPVSLCHDFATRLIGITIKTAKEEGKSSLTNFGSFTVSEISEREGINPQTGEPITISAHKKLTFSTYKALEERVNAPFAHLESIVADDTATEQGEEKAIPQQAPVKAVKNEPEVKREAESAPGSEPPVPKVFVRPGKKEQKESKFFTALIMVLLLVVITTSLWWFLLRDSGTQPITGNNINRPEVPAEIDQPQEERQDANDLQSQTSTDNQNADDAETPAAITEESQEDPGQPENATATPQIPDGQPNSVTSTEKAEAPDPEEDPDTYDVNRGEWLYDIARDVYNRATLWPLIFDANYGTEKDPDLILAGPEIIIPELEGTPYNLTPADRERLSKALYSVAEAYEFAGKAEQAENYRIKASRLLE